MPFLWLSSAQAASFQDLAGVSWARAGIAVLHAEGVVTGTDHRHFSPNLPVERQAFVVMLARLFGWRSTAPLRFRDAQQAAGWAREALSAAANRGVLQGIGQGLLAPTSPLTRAEAATLLLRALAVEPPAGTLPPFRDGARIPSWARPAIRWLWQSGVLAGFPDHTVRPAAYLTRAQVAVLLARAEVQLQGMPLPPGTFVGPVESRIYPDRADLVAAGRGEGPYGGVLLSAGALHPFAADARLYLGQSGVPVSFFALGQADPAVAVLGRDGAISVLWDLRSPSGAPTLADADGQHLYLSDGSILPLLPDTVLRFADQTLPETALPALLGSSVRPLGSTLLFERAVFTGVIGTVVALTPDTVEIDVTDDPTSLFGTGTLRFARTAATRLVALSPGAPTLTLGDTVTLAGTLTAGRMPLLTTVFY